jgi:hypothetical protein
MTSRSNVSSDWVSPSRARNLVPPSPPDRFPFADSSSAVSAFSGRAFLAALAPERRLATIFAILIQYPFATFSGSPWARDSKRLVSARTSNRRIGCSSLSSGSLVATVASAFVRGCGPSGPPD